VPGGSPLAADFLRLTIEKLRAPVLAGLEPPPPTSRRRRAVAIVLVAVIFLVIVAAHQLTPYIALAGVGALAVLGLIRPWWLVLVLAAIAGGYLAPRYGLIAHNFGGLFSGGNPIQNASGSRGTAHGGPQAATALIVRGLAGVLPPPTQIVGELGKWLDASGLPDVFVGFEPFPAPKVDPPTDALARAIAAKAIASTLIIRADACGYVLSGTGFVVRPGYIVTNAHVVAGSHSISIGRDGGARTRATAVLFDPELDVALLYAPGLGAPPLTLANEIPQHGTLAAALGHPGGGSLATIPAAVTSSYKAQGRDIYGTTLVTREIIELRAAIIQGDSGGPVVLQDGTVGGVVFAQAQTDSDVGYALSPVDVAARIQPGLGQTATVDTGPCTR